MYYFILYFIRSTKLIKFGYKHSYILLADELNERNLANVGQYKMLP